MRRCAVALSQEGGFHAKWMEKHVVSFKGESESHKQWLEDVHRRVITSVDTKLADRVSEMKDEKVPFLVYPEPEDKKLRKKTLTVSAEDLPAAVHMWHPGYEQDYKITWHLGGQKQDRLSREADRSATHDHLVFHNLPKGNKALPFKMPEHYKTVPITNMHISGFASKFGTLNFMPALGLRLYL